LADALGKICTVRGVWGNIDNPTIKTVFPENNIFSLEGLKILIRHIAGYPKRYNKIAYSLIKAHKPDIVVAGHSHILKVIRDKDLNHIHINPGAAGISGFHKVRTMIRFKIDNGKIFDMEVIEHPKKALENV
jgi:putative phosphoesterase